MLPLLASGELDLGTVFLLEPVLTEENCEVVLERARGRSYRTIKRLVAEHGMPIVDAHDQFEPVRAFVTPADADALLFERELARSGHYPHTPAAQSRVVSEQKTYVKFLASDELMEKFEQVKALLSHSRIDATFADVLEVVLDEYIERHSPAARQKRRDARKAVAARGGKPSTVGADGGSRHIPDHIQPFAAGGTHDPANLRLLCAAHNRLAAEHTLGKHAMARYWRRQ